MVTYVSIGDVLAIHATLIHLYGGSDGVRDIGLVESALARPQAGFGGYDAYPTLFEKAAVLLRGIIKNHGFVFTGFSHSRIGSIFDFGPGTGR